MTKRRAKHVGRKAMKALKEIESILKRDESALTREKGIAPSLLPKDSCSVYLIPSAPFCLIW